VGHVLARRGAAWAVGAGPLQRLADYGRAHGLRSLTDPGQDEAGRGKAAGREGVLIAHAITSGLQPLYVTPEETREAGYILTGYFGRKIIGRSVRIHLAGVSQRWLRGLLWDHLVGRAAVPGLPAQRAALRRHAAGRPGAERLPGALRSRRRP
jgi:hypothetical protein